MVCSDRPTTPATRVSSTSTTPFSSPSSSPSSSPTQSPPPSGGAHSPPPVILSPCAACKILRRRCAEKCVLAPYFPPTDPLRFTIAHRVFGASNITKLLQELPEFQRADAVSSMVYEASARIRDPVYGCAGAICQLQKQVSELQAELAMTQAEMFNIQCQQANLVAQFCMEMSQSQEQPPIFHQHEHQDRDDQPLLSENPSFSLDDGGFAPVWEALWA